MRIYMLVFLILEKIFMKHLKQNNEIKGRSIIK